MHTKCTHRYFIRLLFITFLFMLFMTSAPVLSKGRVKDPWALFNNHSLSSLSWSPKGDSIAFVAINHNDELDEGPTQAKMWLMSLSKVGKPCKFRKLKMLTAKQGLPVALFWMGNSRIVWAAARNMSPFVFMQLDANTGKTSRLLKRSFRGVQGTGDGPPFYSPDDVYYDKALKTLFFSGKFTRNPAVYIYSISLSSLKTTRMILPQISGLKYPDGYVTCGTCTVLSRSGMKPRYYLAAYMYSETIRSSGWYLWSSNSDSIKQNEIIAKWCGRLRFPRLSPDRSMLAYMAGNKLMLHNLKTNSSRMLTTILPGDEMEPAIGCFYSWSPDGKKIACVNESRIKIVDVKNQNE